MNTSILKAADDLWLGRTDLTSILDLAGHEAEEVADDILMVPGFGHAFAIRHSEGVVLFDTGSAPLANRLYESVRSWTDLPVTHAVYSHGHIDHVFGLGPFDAEADERGWGRPVVIAHEGVARRFDRYRRTLGYNTVINQRQFRDRDLVWPEAYRYPDVTFATTYELNVGGLELQLTHHRGETDDHCVGWLPGRRVLLPGDLFLWVAPNAGNPQKAQRYPVEWAAALRWMSALGADLMLGGHGVPVTNADRIRQALENTATYLETLIAQTLACINEGATLSETIHRVSAPESLTSLPYLRPLYDEPEFVVRNIWRQFAGWYDGNPAHLKPAPDDQLARELAQLCGGPSVLTARALQLSQDGSHRLASHLAQLAVGAAPEDVEAHEARAQIFARRAEIETSMMAKGIYAWAEAESRAALSGRAPAAEPSGSVLTHEATRGGGSRPPGARGHRR